MRARERRLPEALRFSLILVSFGALACGGSAPPAAETPAEARRAAAEQPAVTSSDAGSPPAEIEPAALPKDCGPESKDKLCLPPFSFVKRLCAGFYPDIALALFTKGTPWTRGYLRANVNAWNASGGASSNDKLVFDEEVLVLAFRAADTGGMVVSGASGNYDVMRWDGTCASLSAEELTLATPPRAKFAKIPWKSLDLRTRDALGADEKVGKVVAERRKECKGASMGAVSLKCVKADDRLSEVIVEYVRGGGPLPAPDLPK